MKMTLEEFRVLPKEEREKMLGKATHAAIKKIHAAGMPSVHGDEKGTYNLYPDGRMEYIPDEPLLLNDTRPTWRKGAYATSIRTGEKNTSEE